MTKNPSTPKPAKAPKSSLVIAALIFLAAAFVLGTIAAIFALPYFAVFALVDGLAAVTLAVLSLRETA